MPLPFRLSVLFIHLKRFEFNFATEMQIKVNSRYEFYDEISMKPGIMLTPYVSCVRHVGSHGYAGSVRHTQAAVPSAGFT